MTPAAFGTLRDELQADATQAMWCHRRDAAVPQIAPRRPNPS